MEAAFRFTICGIDELEALADAGITHVLSLLDPGWPEPQSFAAFAPHKRLDLRCHDIVDPLPGLRRPEIGDIEALLAFARPLARIDGAHLLVHCQRGLSRSTAALALILAEAHPELYAAELFAEIVRLRPRAWPNLRIVELGDALLGRGGTLVDAVARCYRAHIADRPRIQDAMIEMGRTREVVLAESR